MSNPTYLLSLEGGGTRSQAALLDMQGNVLHTGQAGDVNTNFTTYQQAQDAVQRAAQSTLHAAGIPGEAVRWLISALVGPKFGAETYASVCPNAQYQYYSESDVVFARAGIYRPHGVGLVAATGATSFAIRADDGRRAWFGGWGSLLGDEGSAYAMGLLGLRCAARAHEGRLAAPTGLVEAACQHFGLRPEAFREDLVRLAYKKPISRAETAGFAAAVTALAAQGDGPATAILQKVAGDLAGLALHAARQLFSSAEAFDVVAAGGMLAAGEPLLAPLRGQLQTAYPHAQLRLGQEPPAVALGRLALYNLQPQEG